MQDLPILKGKIFLFKNYIIEQFYIRLHLSDKKTMRYLISLFSDSLIFDGEEQTYNSNEFGLDIKIHF